VEDYVCTYVGPDRQAALIPASRYMICFVRLPWLNGKLWLWTRKTEGLNIFWDAEPLPVLSPHRTFLSLPPRGLSAVDFCKQHLLGVRAS
jgi:hypothetical protein